MLAAALLLAGLASGTAPAATSEVDTRRVEISFTFAGRELLLWGQAPAETRAVAAVMQVGARETVRLMEHGRVALFWLGVRQYSLDDAPVVYLLNLSCPTCNGMRTCPHEGALDAVNTILAKDDIVLGRSDAARGARVAALSGELAPGETDRVLDGYWTLQAKRGLYAIRPNAIRINPDSVFYHRFPLPASAPDGRYRVTTYFLGADGLIDRASTEVFVRKSGVVAWLSLLAERRAAVYGIFTILIAVAAGWVAGTLFRRTGH